MSPDSGNESWGITANLGTTALGVASQRAAETAQPHPLVRDDFASVMVAAANQPGWQTMATGDLSWMGPEDDKGRRAAETGRNYVATRTVFFDDYCAAAVAAGIGQIVILASGLDARSYRLQCLSTIDVYEIDQPEVLAFKESVLTAHGATALAALRLVPIDLRVDSWPSVLGAAGFETSRPTAWLAEGLLPYLGSDEHDRLFTVVTALSAPGSQLAAEVYPNAELSFGAKRMGKWREGAKDMNDTIGVSMDVASFIKDDDATDTAVWLSRRGWVVETLDSREEMNRHGRPIPVDVMDIAPVSSFVTARLGRMANV
jgi:methyltransferase (TIGR00027 family)